jgi:quercetin dioxygenase-like cupin family protein
VKAVRITADVSGAYRSAPLAVPTVQRKGEVSADGYRSGSIPRANFNPNPGDAVRAIVLSDGNFTGLASRPGALLTFVISGDLTLTLDSSRYHLEPGDILLTDARSSSVPIEARNQCRLLQIGVPADWPGAGAKVQQPGTLIPRPLARAPKLKRIYKGKDDKAYFTEFSELFPKVLDEWGAPHAITGFRLLCWENGSMDSHPCVTNQLAIALAGEMEMEVGGGGGAVEVFHAGDICLAEDRTGEGHIGRFRGVVHVVIMVLETENLW